MKLIKLLAMFLVGYLAYNLLAFWVGCLFGLYLPVWGRSKNQGAR